MKYIFFMAVICIYGPLKAQSNDSLYIIVDNYKDTISKNSDGIFDLHLQNESSFPIIIPETITNGPLYAIPKTKSIEIIYELVYINSDGKETFLNKNNYVGIDQINPYRYEILDISKSKKIICYLDYGLLKKVGSYKVRFCFKAGLLNKYYTNVYSEWIHFFVKNPNFIEID